MKDMQSLILEQLEEISKNFQLKLAVKFKHNNNGTIYFLKEDYEVILYSHFFFGDKDFTLTFYNSESEELVKKSYNYVHIKFFFEEIKHDVLGHYYF